MGLLYRRAVRADVEALAQFRAAFLAEVRGVSAADESLLTALRDYFAAALPTGEFIAYLAESDGQIIATSGLVFHQHPPSPRNLSGREAYIMNMYTLPAWRGRGIAHELLQRLIDFAREAGCPRVALHALPKAIAIYARAGFTPSEGEMRRDL